MAQSYLDSLLSDREEIILISRQHWFLLTSAIFLELTLILITLAITISLAIFFPAYALLITVIGFALMLIPIATMTHDILKWANRQFIVTNRRVMQIAGVINKNITDSSLEKVNDVKMEQSALGRIFDYGNIEILTASEFGVNSFPRIEEPVSFKTAMLNAKERLERGETTPGPQNNIPDLIARLDQLRQQGLISDDEFEVKKAELLARL